jgi:hypothetical protein
MAARVSPRWERIQRAKGAAAYAGYRGERDFLAAVAEGAMPAPFKLGGADAWDLHDLDAAIDALKAGAQVKRPWQQRAPARV